MSTLTFTDNANFTAVSNCAVADGSVAQNAKGFNNSTIDAYADNWKQSWKLNETSGTRYNFISGGIDLSTVGSAVGYTSGINGNCATFDGSANSYLRAASTWFSGKTAFTVSMWAHLTTVTACWLFSERNATYIPAGLVVQADGAIRYRINISGTEYGATTGTGLITNSGWHHYVLTYNGASLKLYLDASNISTTTVSGTIYSPTSPALVIGGIYTGTYAGAPTGKIDSVNFWDTAISADAITAIYNAGNGRFSQYQPAVFTVNDSGVGYIDACSGAAGQSLDLSTLTKSHTAGAVVAAEYYHGNDNNATPSYTSYTWAELLALAANNHRYHWLRLTMSSADTAASFDEMAVTTYSVDTTPPTTPSSTETSTPQGKSYTLVNWTQPADADFDHCELRRTKNGSHEYLANSSGSQAWQSSPTTYWKIREGTGGTGISPASSFLDESITSVTAYAVRSVDALGNASAWTACTAIIVEYCDASNVLLGVDRGDGVTGTFDEASRNTDPGAANVLTGTSYKIQGTTHTGTLISGAGSVFPDEDDVLARAGAYGPNGDDYTGNATLPSTSKVLTDTSYGSGGTEFTGQCILPLPADVRLGVEYGEPNGD